MTEAETLLIDLRRHVKYFRECAQTDPLFTAEAESAEEIVSIIESRGFTAEALVCAVAAANRIAGTEHYNGSGWCILKSQLVNACQVLGLFARVRVGGGYKRDPGIHLGPRR